MSMRNHRTASMHSVDNTPTTIPPSPEEGVVAHVARSTKNGFYSCFGCMQTSPDKAKILYTEYEIEQRKKIFGVEYMNLLKNSTNAAATASQLQACIDRAMREIGELEAVVTELRSSIAKKEQEMNSKMSGAGKPNTTTATVPSTAQGVPSSGASATSATTSGTELPTVSTTAALTGTGDGMLSAVSGQAPPTSNDGKLQDVSLENNE